jgi:hypothetical protein
MRKSMPESRIRVLMAACIASPVLLFSAGCSSGGGANSVPTNTHATLLVTSTNNAKIPIFKFNIQALTLVADDGTSIPILTTPQLVELSSLNGAARPLVTVDIPSKTYVSATLSYGPSTFTVIDRSAGPTVVDVATYNFGPQSTTPIAVKLSLDQSPLVIAGSAMGVLLNLNIPSSTTYTPFVDGSPILVPDGGVATFNPVFSVSAVSLAANPSTFRDGNVEDVHGQVTASSGSALTIATDSGSSLTFDTSSAVIAGASAATAPPVGSYVDVDAALQADGSILATHIQTETTSLLYDVIGQATEYTSPTYIAISGRELQGPNLGNQPYSNYNNYLQFDPSTHFEISWPSGTAPTGLPFTPTLNAGSILPGQNLATPIESLEPDAGIYPEPGVVTLEPQTINGTVATISNINGQTTYQITLFNDDLITLFGSTQTVVAYSTAQTHTITTSPLSVGSVARVRGLLFDDGGTLRMVATEIEDGVPGS